MGKSSKSKDESESSSSDSSVEENFRKEALGENDKESEKKENLISKKDSTDTKRKSSKNKEVDSSSSSDDSKKKKKTKKSKKKKDKKDKKIHKSEKDKKKKHHKKHHKKNKKKKEKKYGKYGLITMTDMNMKKEEFMHWLRERKSINIEAITHTQEKKLFEEYMEDYNTCSFPSKKYYNLREWERRQLGKREKEASGNNETLFMNDEAQMNEERKKIILKFQMEKVQAALYQLHNNQEMIVGMNEEQELKDKMKHYYKIGKTDEAQKISKLFEQKKEFEKN